MSVVLTGFGAYAVYIKVKTHFTSDSYDFFDSGLRISDTAYENRKDQKLFNSLAIRHRSEENLTNFLVYCFSHMESVSPTELLNTDNDIAFRAHEAKLNALGYHFENDLTIIFPDGLTQDDIYGRLSRKGDSYPPIVDLCLRNKILIESYIILDHILRHNDAISIELGDDIIWKRRNKVIQKYKRFLQKYKDLNHFEHILNKKLNTLQEF
jgi:hypothetical protein